MITTVLVVQPDEAQADVLREISRSAGALSSHVAPRWRRSTRSRDACPISFS